MIETTNLTKKFGNFTAVNNLSFSVKQGESYGFLGPNGSGKTTTLMMMLGVLKPTSGSVYINGEEVRTNSFSIKKKIGVVTEYQSYYENMSAWEYIQFFANLYEVESFEKNAADLLDRLDLLKWKNVLIKGYSTGMKKKLGFVRALIHDPEILILDEPVSGLDPFSIKQVRELLIDIKKTGCGLLISSHILSEIEKTVDRVGIIYNGRMVAEDTMDGLRQMIGQKEHILLEFKNLNESQAQIFLKLPFVKQMKQNESKLSLYLDEDSPENREMIGNCILQENLIIMNMNKIQTSLEETFITITEKNLSSITEKVQMNRNENE